MFVWRIAWLVFKSILKTMSITTVKQILFIKKLNEIATKMITYPTYVEKFLKMFQTLLYPFLTQTEWEMI